MVLSPKAKSAGWTGVHRPHTKLADVLARHKGQADWAETIVDDESLFAQWISMGPGSKTPRRMNGDTREWWIVQSGTLRFTVDGREPVVATKGVMVQVPYRTFYQIENVGTEPALRFEVNVTRARKLYPMDETPVPVAGFEYVQDARDGRARRARSAEPAGRGLQQGRGRPGARRRVRHRRSQLRQHHHGPYQKPQPGNKGHYHEEGGEFWLIMLGKIRYNIEGLERIRSRRRRRRVRPAADVAPGELRRTGRSALVPPGDERLPVSGPHVRGRLMRLAIAVRGERCSLIGVLRRVVTGARPRTKPPRLLLRLRAARRPGTVTLPTGFPERPFVRVEFDKLTWRPTEGNTLGVETAVVEGDPSKPGYYLTINHFPAGVMSRPHYHPDERYVIVLRGTWYTDEGEVFRPKETVPLKPGDFMRHPKGGPHYDGALNEDTWVAISGYGPTKATVIDGGELFGKSR